MTFSSSHPSFPVRLMQLRGRRGGLFTIIGSGLIGWPSSVKCHGASIIGISLTQLPHTVNTLSLITAVRAGCSREALFVFFFLFWAAWGGSGVEQFTQAGKAHKRGCTTSYSGEDWCGDYISYRRGAAMVTDCGMSLCGFPSTRAQIINNLHSVWHQPSLQGKASLSRQTTEQYFTRNDVVLGGRLRLSI